MQYITSVSSMIVLLHAFKIIIRITFSFVEYLLLFKALYLVYSVALSHFLIEH